MSKLDKQFIIDLSKKKHEPSWMLDFRLRALNKFEELENPNFGPLLNIDFEKILYYKNDYEKNLDDWEKVNKDVKQTFCSLGVVDAENKYLDGVTNQFESEVIYHNTKTDKNIIFTSTDDALAKYPELFKKYFNNLVKYDENKYTA